MNKENKFTRVTSIVIMILSVIFAAFPASGKANVPVIKEATPVYRLSGADRYQTSAAISKEGWATSEYVILATGEGDDKFADALSGSPLSFALKAPMLLTATDTLTKDVQDEIKRLNSKRAILLGGTGVISANVEAGIAKMGLTVERLWGNDRYETAVKIGEMIRKVKPSSKVFLTTGEEFQYAMMIAPYASRNNMPILFTQKDTLNPTTSAALIKWGIDEVNIIGGTNVISQAIEDGFKVTGIRVNRVSGADINEVNINIMNTYKIESRQAAIARDDIFADGLAGASFAALKGMPVILTGPAAANQKVINLINSLDFDTAYVFGGPGAVSDNIISTLRKGIGDLFVSGNTNANITSGGLAAVRSGWVYYHNGAQGGKLYKIKSDGTEKIQVSSDVPWNINVIGDWIYYTNLSDNSRLYKIKADGTCRAKLNDDESWNVVVMDNWIYYMNNTDQGHLYKIATDGTSRAKINNHDSKFINVTWNYIYYVNDSDNRSIYRIKRDAPYDMEKLTSTPPLKVWGINVSGDYICFSNENDRRKLYKVRTTASGMEMICSDVAYDIHVLGDYIYYSNFSDGDKIYKIKIDGTEKTKIYDGSAYLLNIAGDTIYFSQDQEGLLLYKIKLDGSGLSAVN